MIIEFEPNKMSSHCPPEWTLYYKGNLELKWYKINVTYDILKMFLEKYGYESPDVLQLIHFGIDTTNIKLNDYCCSCNNNE